MSLANDFFAGWNAFRASRQKRRRGADKLEIRDTKNMLTVGMFNLIRDFAAKADKVPAYGTLERAAYLDRIWREEPILAGAVYSMVAKMQALTWRIEGGKRNATYYAKLLARAAYGHKHDWSGFIASCAEDFYTQDNGVFIQLVRSGNAMTGKLTDIGHIDSQCCVLTGSAAVPMIYSSAVTGQVNEPFRKGEFIHIASLPSAREEYFGAGFCAVSRALRAAKLLMGLHDYDAEKLANLPPEGVAAVTGMTPDEFYDALELWRKMREADNSLTFPQVLWLLGSQPNANVGVDFVGFSQIPESFDRQTVVSQYVNTLALCFGVDTREFWAISTGALGTAAEAEVQHLKAKGKGAGEFIVLIERALNGELPDDVIFRFDTQDIEEDMIAAGVAKAWVDAYLPLVTDVEALELDQFKRLLVDKGVLPEWIMSDERLTISSSEVHGVHKELVEDIICYVWEMGKLKTRPVVRLAAPVAFKQLPATTAEDVIDGEVVEPVRAIHGKPIPEKEIARGATVSKKAIKNELRRWGTIPELQPYTVDISEVDTGGK